MSRDDHREDRNNLRSSQQKTHSERTPCRHGDSCFSADCPYKHSQGWHACKNGAQCNDYYCSANHSPNRKGPCRYKDRCRKRDCSYLHPSPSCSKNAEYVCPNEYDSEKADLPILEIRKKFSERLQKEKLILVTADAACGASIQLPKYAAKCFPNDLVVCTQQHPNIAMTLARRVAEEFDGTAEGNSVGYQIGTSNQQANALVMGRNIMFMTEAVLIDHLKDDPNLSTIRVLIIDNIHERSINCDIILGITKLLLNKRKVDLHVVLIAPVHFDPAPFLKFFDCPSSLPLNIKHQTYSVTTENLPAPTDCPEYKFIELHVIPTLYELYTKYEGHILVFLSGQRDIEKALEIFNCNIPNGCIALPFYGSLSAEEQKHVLQFDQEQSNQRMIVFCTNILETIFTIKNVQLVIDTGLARQMHFDSQHRLSILETVRISKFSANQRRDKVSDMRNGHCVRLYNDNELINDNITPEILRASCDLLILRLKYLHFDLNSFPLMTKPDSDSIRCSFDLLRTLICIDKEDKLTKHGQLCAELLVSPRLSALMINVYTEYENGLQLLSLAATIVAILSNPVSFFLNNDPMNDFRNSIHSSTMFNKNELNSDLLILAEVFSNWRKTGIINQVTHKCVTCNQKSRNQADVCHSCRKNYSRVKGLNNEILQLIEHSIKFYVDSITNSRWKLVPGSKVVDEKVSDGKIIGEHLRQLFPDQIGHLLLPHLPDGGIRLTTSDLRATIDNRSIYVQRAHDSKRQYFMAMLITRSLSGKFIVTYLHEISGGEIPEFPIEQLMVRENIGRSMNKKIRSVFNDIRLETWAKWLLYEYDQTSCRLTIWGLKAERSRLESLLQPILTNTGSKMIEFGSIRATFQNGLICSSMEFMENTLRLNLQRVPCKTYEQLQHWLKSKLDINRKDIKENNFQESKSSRRNDDDDEDDDYEAPPFYILLKSVEVFQKATARLPSYYLCPQAILSSSTTGTHMNEKDAWGRHLVLTIPKDSRFMTSKEILNHLNPHAIDCRQFGRRNIKAHAGIQLENLSRDTDESLIRQILQPISPLTISLKQTHKDGTGSASAHIFFADENDCQRAIQILQSDFCQKPIQITVRHRTSHQLVKKQIVPIVTALERKTSYSSRFLITAIDRQSAFQIYNDIVPKSESSWKIDGSATVTVTHPYLYPDFDTLVQQIANKFEVQVQQQELMNKQQHNGHNSIRCYYNHGSPQKTALAASMLAQATSPIIIKMTSYRQKQLFDELFQYGIIQDWSSKLKLEVIKKERTNTWVEILGPQVQQGQLMRQIADYSDTFDERFRVFELNSITANFFGRKRLADTQLQAITDTWSNWGCDINYIPKIQSIVIYVKPQTPQKLIDSCEKDVTDMLSKLSMDGNIVRNKKKCVFCGKTSYSTNTLSACGHAYCRCASTYLLDKAPLQCNESHCKMNIDMNDMFQIFYEREELVRACKTSLQIYLKNNPSVCDQLLCPNPTCEGLVKRDRGYQTCLTCARDVCPACSLMDDEIHQGKTCEERNMVHRMGEFLPNLFQSAEKFARENWPTNIPPIIRIDYNTPLAEQCSSLKRFYKGVEALGQPLPPDMARGFFTFHGTAPNSIKPICTDGFDPQRRSGQAYGVGEYFGVTAAVSHGYSCRGGQGPYSMIITFLLNCSQLSTHGAFCHVMNNPLDWSHAFNLPVIVVSYGTQTTCPSPFGT